MKTYQIIVTKGGLTISDYLVMSAETPEEETLEIARDWFLEDWAELGFTEWDSIVINELRNN